MDFKLKLNSLSEFKFFRSFRLRVTEEDELSLLIDHLGHLIDAKVLDISSSGLAFKTKEKLSIGEELTFTLRFRKGRLELSGQIVRIFTDESQKDLLIYGLELESSSELQKFLESFIASFSSERMRECLQRSILENSYTDSQDELELFSLIISLFQDITQIKNKALYAQNLLEEVLRILDAKSASLLLINPKKNELEAFAAAGIDKNLLKFDYRMGVAGSVFTSKVPLNLNVKAQKARPNPTYEKLFLLETKSAICYPIYNHHDKVIGVIEVLNKRSQDSFSSEDEKIMKMISLIFSSIFHDYDPLSKESKVRQFGADFDREYALIGSHKSIQNLRSMIIRLKDINAPLLITGETGVGKTLYAKIIHSEGQRTHLKFDEIDLRQKINDDFLKSVDQIFKENFSGTILFKEITKLALEFQERLLNYLLISGQTKESGASRLIFTSSDDIASLVDSGAFHKNLYEYICQTHIHIPPLRQRSSDIEDLVNYFAKKESKAQGVLAKTFAPKVIDALENYDWPSNVRELQTCVARSILYFPKEYVITEISLDNFEAPIVDINQKRKNFSEHAQIANDTSLNFKHKMILIEYEMILSIIKRLNGNKSQAARELGLSREGLRKKILLAKKVLKSQELGNNEEKNTLASKKIA